MIKQKNNLAGHKSGYKNTLYCACLKHNTTIYSPSALNSTLCRTTVQKTKGLLFLGPVQATVCFLANKIMIKFQTLLLFMPLLARTAQN